jgi:hypothetical protein
MKIIKFNVIIALILFLFIQCEKEKGKLLGTLYFTEEDKQIIPYDSTATIALMDSLGGTIEFSVHMPSSHFETWHDPDGFPLNTQDDIEYLDYYDSEYILMQSFIYKSMETSFGKKNECLSQHFKYTSRC